MNELEHHTRKLLTSRPELEPDLQQLLEIDSTDEPWTASDTTVNQQTIDELVSREIVHASAEGYRLADRSAVQDALHDTSWRATIISAGRTVFSRGDTTFDRRLQLALFGALALVIAIRMLPFPDVFRNGDIVLSGNDPYRIRYWVERLAAQSTGVFDLGVISTLPDNVATVDPLTILSLWWVTELFGGSKTAAGTVLAFYPVVSAVITAVFVYLLAVHLSDDPRVGLAAVGLLAVAPGHAFRTGLGFADHHAFDYPWLTLTVLTLVVLVGSHPRDRRTWLTAGVLGIAVAGQTLAWQASPILLAPLAICIAVFGFLAVREGTEGALTLGPVIAALALATAITMFFHTVFGWPIAAVAYMPGLILIGSIGVFISVILVAKAGRSAPTLAGLQTVSLGMGVLVFLQVAPRIAPGFITNLVGYVNRGIAYFAGLQSSSIGETKPLAAEFGPIAGPLIMLGYSVFLGLPVTVWAVWRAYDRNEPGWLLVSVYIWYFLGWSLIQRRFTGELAPVLAVLAGLGFIYLLSWLELVSIPKPMQDEGSIPSEPTEHAPTLRLPGRRRLLILGALSLIIGSFPAIFTAFIHKNLAIDEKMYRAAVWMRAYAEDREWEYPQNYVFSQWGRNRVYNYFVSGESRSYAFAKRNFSEFLTASPEASVDWYNRLRDRTGFIVTRDSPLSTAGPYVYSQLHQNFGSEGSGLPGLAHYRAVYASPDAELKVFTLVQGATLSGKALNESEFQLATNVAIPGAQFEYRRQVQTAADGTFSVTVPYPGDYALQTADVTVSEKAVLTGKTVQISTDVES